MEEKLALTQEWDKTFPRSDRVDHRKVTFHNRYGVALAADLYAPKNASGKLPGIAVCGPFGAVKEQAAGLYAQAMAERGFLTIAFDPSFTGESGGQPRYMASPDINTEDYQAAVDFLSARGRTSTPAKIGILGICGWGGLALNAAALDTRVKATAAITMYDMARIAARGYFDAADSEPARHEARRAFNAQRTLDYRNGSYALAGGVADPRAGRRALLRQGLPRLLQDRTGLSSPLPQLQRRLERRGHDVLPQPARPLLRERDPLRRAHRPRRKAHSCYMSRDAYARMMDGNPCPENKELLILPGKVHTDLYDRMDAIPFDKLEAFFRKYL